MRTNHDRSTAFKILTLITKTSIITVLAAAILLRKPLQDIFFTYPTFTKSQVPSLCQNKTFVITGANSGLGYSSTKLLAQAGTAKLIIMGCRNLTKCTMARDKIINDVFNHDVSQEWQEEYKTKIIALHLDLSSIESVKYFASEVQRILSTEQHTKDINHENTSIPVLPPPPLDVLLNNAGIMFTNHTLSPQTNVELQMQSNHIGHFALTSLLLPNLQQSQSSNGNGGGRIVSVSSLAAALPFCFRRNDINFEYGRKYNPIVAYAQSKKANLMFTHGLHARYHDRNDDDDDDGNPSTKKNIVAIASHPGYSRTSIVLSGWYFAPKLLKKLFTQNKIGSMSSDNGAMSQLRAALDVENVSSDDYVGPMWGMFGRPVVWGMSTFAFPIMMWRIGEDDVEALWEFSEKVIGWKFSSL